MAAYKSLKFLHLLVSHQCTYCKLCRQNNFNIVFSQTDSPWIMCKEHTSKTKIASEVGRTLICSNNSMNLWQERGQQQINPMRWNDRTQDFPQLHPLNIIIINAFHTMPGPHLTNRSYFPCYNVNFTLLCPVSSHFFSPLQIFSQDLGGGGLNFTFWNWQKCKLWWKLIIQVHGCLDSYYG